MLQAFHFGTVIENNSLKKISNTMHANNKLDQYCSNLKKNNNKQIFQCKSFQLDYY